MGDARVHSYYIISYRDGIIYYIRARMNTTWTLFEISIKAVKSYCIIRKQRELICSSLIIKIPHQNLPHRNVIPFVIRRTYIHQYTTRFLLIHI